MERQHPAGLPPRTSALLFSGQCLKHQLLGLPERDREIDKVCETLRIIGEAYKDKSAAEAISSTYAGPA